MYHSNRDTFESEGALLILTMDNRSKLGLSQAKEHVVAFVPGPRPTQHRPFEELVFTVTEKVDPFVQHGLS